MFPNIIALVPLFLSIVPSTLAQPTTKPYCPPRPATPQEQARILNEFRVRLWVDRNVTLAFHTHVHEDYIMHAPLVQSGRQNAIDALTPLWPTVTHQLYHQGFDERTSTGFIHLKASDKENNEDGKKYRAVMNVLRMNGTCIVENWDIIQERPANAINELF